MLPKLERLDRWKDFGKVQMRMPKYIPKTGLLYRGYSKGSESDTDGMQVYKNSTLVAHFNVPKGMRIAGYAAPWYYSDADVDERNEIMKTHRFKLEL